MNFNPDTNDENNKKEQSTEVFTPQSPVIINESSDVLSITNLLNVTLSHIEDDKKVREEVETITDILNDSIYQMSIKELLDYLKVKIKEREFHVDCIFKAYTFVQRTELAKEMLFGSERRERIIEATDRTNVNNLLTMFNSVKPNEE